MSFQVEFRVSLLEKFVFFESSFDIESSPKPQNPILEKKKNNLSNNKYFTDRSLKRIIYILPAILNQNWRIKSETSISASVIHFIIQSQSWSITFWPNCYVLVIKLHKILVSQGCFEKKEHIVILFHSQSIIILRIIN